MVDVLSTFLVTRSEERIAVRTPRAQEIICNAEIGKEFNCLLVLPFEIHKCLLAIRSHSGYIYDC